ncbi:hypothetical protein C0992_004103 [Termitomyces sp. T32_za158]|nr:hypothetical protein C0992_004103 [Termitomyces sp. T32_za158]
MLSGNIIWNAVKRLDVGGKLLTNHLKELVSFRQWNMMDQTYIMNDVKEACCYVSQNFRNDLETCRGGLFQISWVSVTIVGAPFDYAFHIDSLTLGLMGRMSELRSLAPTDCEVVIYECDEPITEAYRAAVAFAGMAGFTNQVVTRAEYAESGSNASRRKIRDWKPRETEKEKPKESAKLKVKQKEDDRSQAHTKPSRTRTKLSLTSTITTRKR